MNAPPPPAQKPIENDKDKLLANLATISFHFTDSDSTHGQQNLIIKNLATDAVNRLRDIKIVESSPKKTVESSPNVDGTRRESRRVELPSC